jgi:hypothetical protein
MILLKNSHFPLAKIFSVTLAIIVMNVTGWTQELSPLDKIKQLEVQLTSENCVSLIQSHLPSLQLGDAETVLAFYQSNEPHFLREELWEHRIRLHEKMKYLSANQSYSLECGRSFRSLYLSLRGLEDYLDLYIKNKNPQLPLSADGFSAQNNQRYHHPEYKDFQPLRDLKSGDVLLTRGNAYTSAAIANMGEGDGQFSHMSLVYRDENNKLWTVEAHIEVGSFVRPIEDHIKDGNARTAFFRFSDAELAAKAASYIFNRVKNTSEQTGNIPYDFPFLMEESDNLFCSEIFSHALDVVSGGQVQIPYVRNRLFLTKPLFVKQIGIKAAESFLPQDIETDPRMTFLAEWKDLKKLSAILEKDHVLQALYRWSANDNYKLVQSSSFKSWFYRNIVWVLRRTPVLKKYVEEKLPLNMSRTLIGYFGVVESLGEELQKRLNKTNKARVKKTSIILLPNEAAAFLDLEKKQDLDKARPIIHEMMRPLDWPWNAQKF